MNIYQKLIKARLEFLKSNPKKSGNNKYADYKYFELQDIIPNATKIFNEIGLVLIPTFTDNLAIAKLINTEKPEETILFTSPMKNVELKGTNAIQNLGAVETYQRRYLYLMALDIVESDTFDATQGKQETNTNSKKTNEPKEANKPSEPKENNKASGISFKTRFSIKCGERNLDKSKIAKAYKISAETKESDYETLLAILERGDMDKYTKEESGELKA